MLEGAELMPAEAEVVVCMTPACWTLLVPGIIPGREFVSVIPSDLLPGMVEAMEFIGGLANASVGWRDISRLPGPGSLD